MQHSIRELATEFGITTRAILFYEEKGLLNPVRDGTKRIYSATDKTHLKLVLRGKRIGFSLDESTEIIELYNPISGNCEQLNLLLKKIEEKRAEIKQQLTDLTNVLEEMKDIKQQCEETML